LGQIHHYELFRRLHCPDFTTYLAAERIDLPYATAMNYSVIGVVLIRFKKELDEVGYDPVRDGINKLRLIAKASRNGKGPGKDVFQGLVSMSYRGLKKHIDHQQAAPGPSNVDPVVTAIHVDDESILMDCGAGCSEIVWFEPEAFTSSAAQQSFLDDIARICRTHIHAFRRPLRP
jgi:hypothetical protein